MATQKRLEAMTIEFEEMTKTCILSDEEARMVLQKRKAFENRLGTCTRTLKDINEYIAYELCLYRMIKLRRERLQIESRHNLEYKILKRIKNLYSLAMSRYPANIDIYLSFFKFCKETKFRETAENICNTMLKNHKNDENIWLLAARWYLRDKQEITFALSVLKKGLAIHKSSKVLFTECIYYEIKNLKIEEEDENVDEKIATLNKKLSIYIDEMFQYIDDCEHYVNVLNILDNFDFTVPAQQKIIDHLMDEYKGNGLTWDYLAKRETKQVSEIDSGVVESKTAFLKPMQLLNSIKKYEEGLQFVPAENKEALRKMYLKFLVDIKEKQSTADVRVILFDAFSKVSSMGPMPEECYITWLSLANDQSAVEILKTATTHCPTSCDLWKLRVRYEILKGPDEDIWDIFLEGSQKLQEASIDLWLTMLEYVVTLSDVEVEKFYRNAIEKHAKAFKPKYIEWLAKKKGIDSCRAAYLSLAKQEPHCKGLYLTMLEIESRPVGRDYNAWERVHKLGCQEFGKEDVDVWIRYLDFLLYNKPGTTVEDTKAMYKSARAALEHSLVIGFDEEYNAKIRQFESAR